VFLIPSPQTATNFLLLGGVFNFCCWSNQSTKLKKHCFVIKDQSFKQFTAFHHLAFSPKTAANFFIIWQYLQFLLLKRSKYKVEKVLFFDQRPVLKKITTPPHLAKNHLTVTVFCCEFIKYFIAIALVG